MKVRVAAQNRSSRACQPADPRMEIRDGSGNAIGGVGVADAFTMGIPGQPLPSWDPGETLAMSLTWPATCGSADRCPPGRYTVTARFGPFPSAPAAFTLL